MEDALQMGVCLRCLSSVICAWVSQYVSVIVNICVWFNKSLYVTISMFQLQCVTQLLYVCNYWESVWDSLHMCSATFFVSV